MLLLLHSASLIKAVPMMASVIDKSLPKIRPRSIIFSMGSGYELAEYQGPLTVPK